MADLADELNGRGPSTGYGVFWVALPVQYFGGSDVTLTSVECDADGDPLVANFANLDTLSSDADRSFFVLWDRPTAQCSRDQITEAFGTPVDEERFELDDGTWGHFTVLWFDGNIGADIGRAD